MAVIPGGAIERLRSHYGDSIVRWLDEVPSRMADVCRRRGLTLGSYHDAGWTSVVCVARDEAGSAVILKAVPDRQRYERERDGLAHWAGEGVCRMLGYDDEHQVVLLVPVSGAVGGAPRPKDHERRVAERLGVLHQREAASTTTVPTAQSYYERQMIPRMKQRTAGHGPSVDEMLSGVLTLDHLLLRSPEPWAMLHTDLYAENVLFDVDGTPMFIDPHPRVGPSAFDWAFWCVYYVPYEGFVRRLELSAQLVPEQYKAVVAWSATLALDGYLYYQEVGNGDAPSMLAILRTAAVEAVLATDR